MADENIEQMRELAEVTRRAAEEMQRYGSVSRATFDQMTRLQQSTARLTTGTNSLAGAFGRAGTSINDAADRFERAGRQFAGAVEDGADAVIAMGSSLYQGQKGAATFNQSIVLASRSMQGLVGSVTKLIPQLGGLGAAFNLGTKALTVFVTAATQQADALYNSFSALTKSGGSAADGMTGVFETAKSLGLSMNELGALTDAVGARAQDFALFGGTVFTARKRLGDLGESLRQNREQFFSLGMLMPDVTEGLANYISLQGRLGRRQTQNTEQLAASARKYLLEQDALTRALGISRQEQESANQRALMQEQFLAKVNLLRAQGNEAAADALLALSRRAAAVGPGFEEGIQALVSGNIQNEQAARVLQSTSGEAAAAIAALESGTVDVDQAFQRIAEGGRDFQATVGNMAALVGANNQNFTALNEQQRLSIIATNGFVEGMKQISAEQERMGAQSAKAQDEMLANQARLMEIQTRANETLERFVGEAIVPTQEALITFTDAIANSTEKLREFFFGEQDRQLGATERNITALEENTKALNEAKLRLSEAESGDVGRQTRRGRKVDPELEAARREVERLQDEEREILRRIQSQQTRRGQRASGLEVPGFEFRQNSTAGIQPEAPAATSSRTPATAAPVQSQRGFEAITEQQLQQMGLKIKPGYTQAPGRSIQNNTVDLAKKVQEAVPGFVRFTGFNDAYPRGETGASRHPRGAAFDFTLDYDPSIAQGRELTQMLRGMGASRALDEYNFRSDRATAGHIHVEVPLMARGGITDGVSIAGEAGPEAVVPLPDGRAIPVDMNLGGMAREFAQEAATNFVKDAVPGFRELENMKAAADQPSASAIADVVRLLNPTVGGHMKQAAALHDAATQESTEMDRLLDVLSVVVPKFGLLRSAFNRIENLLPDATMTAAVMPQAEIGSRVSTSDIGSEIGERVKEVVAGTATGTTEALQQIQREFTDNMRDVVQRMEQQQNPQLQQEMLAVLNSINRNQGRTADASQRMADVAMN